MAESRSCSRTSLGIDSATWTPCSTERVERPVLSAVSAANETVSFAAPCFARAPAVPRFVSGCFNRYRRFQSGPPSSGCPCIDHDYEHHIALIRDERPANPKPHKPRRWVVECTLAWLSTCRAILVRWDKKPANYLGLLKLACALLWFHRYHRLTRRT